ncbi:T9SS type A sorting domain-containing protein [Flavobacterium qiangtangense]|uniref:T9SS type A sorting domain-containing protein n=2 Tax=Flavobacterium qiangtangense TaxID=1442595 RepID=A0ABW1PPU7_9FLAO
MPNSIFAQSSANYAFATSTSGSLSDMTGSTQLVAAGLDANASAVNAIGFDFFFMGNRFTQFSVQEDGILQLGATVVNTNVYTLTGGTTTSPRLSAFCADFRTGTTSGKIHYKVSGVAPNRVLTVEFLNMQLFYTGTAEAGTSTWQMRLFENGTIEYVYGAMSVTATAGTTNRLPSIGFYTGSTAGSFAAVTYSTHTASTATYAQNPIIAATGVITDLNSAADGSRRTYSFSPGASPSSPTAITFTGNTSTATNVNWVDSSTTESFFIVTRATDAAFTTGVVNTIVQSTSIASTGTAYSSAQSGMIPNTLYYYKITAANEGNVPLTGLLGSNTTLAPGNFISIATGNWNAGTTWDAGVAPSIYDSATVSAGHTVTLNATGLGIANLVVDGTLAYSTTSTTFPVSGNLTVNTSGLVNVFNAAVGKTLTVGGNIILNGIIDLSVGGTTEGTLTLNGSAAQTVSGTGTFKTNSIRNLIFNNTATALPNVNWLMNNVAVAYNLTLTGAKVNLGGNKLTFGNAAAGNTLTAASGTGFMNGKFSRFWNATSTGTAITSATDPTNATSRYPFLSATGLNRPIYITRTNATGAVAGEIAVVYNDATTTASGLSIVDGAYTVTDRYNSNWVVSNEGTAVSASSYIVVLLAENSLYPSNGNVRVIGASAPIGGTHQAGTVTPGAQRINVPQADLFAGPLYIGIASSDIPYVSVASGNWNAPSTWNKGSVPTCTDNVTIASGHTVTVDAVGNVSKGLIVSSGATLSQSAGDLTIGCTLKNNTFTNNGTLTVSGGILNVNGNMSHNSGSTFNQSGGEIIIDGNDAGVAANSVASGTHLLNITASAVGNLNLSGGTITIVDPPQSASTSTYALRVSQGGAFNSASVNHTFKFGNGVSNDSSTTGSNGFYIYLFPGTFYYGLGNVVVDAGTVGVNRFVKTVSPISIKKNLTITSGEYRLDSATYVVGNVVNNGILTTTSTLNLGDFNGSAVVNTVAQSISGTGVFKNLATAETANLNSLTINNTAGATLNVPLSISGTLTLTAGLLNTNNTNLLTLGTATAAGTLSGGSATSYVNGPIARTIATSNTSYILFPVGKSAYAPISLSPATTTVAKMKAEAFDSNTGTSDASIVGLNTSRRWEAPIVSGTITDVKVRIADAGIVATNIPVQAPTEAGIYTSAFGFTATFATGTPNTVQSITGIPSANYTGFIGYATSNVCSGTPTPGNTVASAATICSGSSVTLSLQNLTAGTGVTYVWESSVDGAAFTPISGATASTYSTIPTVPLYYRASVTCGGNTGISTPVQITFTNNILTTTPATRCGIGTVSLAATATAGATINWFNAATNGTLVGTGNTFTTPSISATTNYWAEAQTLGATLAGGIIAPPSDWTGTTLTDWGIIFNTLNAVTINSVDLYSTAAGTVNLKVVNSAGTELYSTGNVNIVNGGVTTPNVVPINFDLPVGNNYKILVKSFTGVSLVRGSTSVAFPYTNSNISVTASEWGGSTTTNYYYIYNIKTTGTCNSPRTQVVATVTAPPALTLSGNPVAFCSGQSSAPVTVTSTVSDYDTYVWSPSTGVSGDVATGWIFNPATTTSYTLTASQSAGSLCSTIASVVVSVNGLPTPITISPSPASVCENTILPLVVTGGTTGVAGKIGSGVATNVVTTPFKGNWGGSKSQALYTAAELSALGLQAGQKVNSIGYVSLAGTPSTFNNFTISAGFVSAATLGTTFISGASTVVYAPATYTPSTGIGNLDFSIATPLVWDGISNLLVETCFNNGTSGNGAASSLSVQSSTVASGLNLHRSQDNTVDVCSNATVPTGVTNRPNLRISTLENANLTWSPITNLYSDATATTAYVAGTNASTVYFKSNTAAAATTYTVTGTTAQSCSITSTVNVTVNAVLTPDFAAIPAFCSGSTAPTLATTSPNGVTGTWSPATVNNTTSGSYVFTPTAGQCANTQTLAVTVTTNTVPNFATIPAFCSGSTAPTLATTSPNGVTGTWSPATVNNTTSGTYVFTPAAGQCATTQTLSVTVTTTAAPTGTSPQDYTTGDTLADFDVTGTGIIWYDAPNGGNVLPASTILVSNVTYYASQTVGGCESPTRLPVTAGVNLKVEGFGFESLKYYPNPVSNVLTVTYSEEITGLKLYNMVGQELMNKKVNSTETKLDMSHLPMGSYLLEVSSGAKSKMVKLIKNQ